MDWSVMEFEKRVVYFAGAGPGDPELITVKVLRLIESADVILYAGSLVNPEILTHARPGAILLSTARMDLPSQILQMERAVEADQIIARLHTGDPSIYGSISEQIRELDARGIRWKIIPGVSAVNAAAAALGIEYTLPESCQSLVLTRLSGKTPMPESESLRSFAKHRCSLCLFLSTAMIGRVVEELTTAGYTADTEIAVIYRASWPDEWVIRGTLRTIEAQLAEAEITHQALIVVSPALAGTAGTDSHLYGTYQQPAASREGIAVVTLSLDAVALGAKIAAALPESTLFVPEKFADRTDLPVGKANFFGDGIRNMLQEAFRRFDSLICIMASGIVIRELAPVLKNKHSDPAVLVLDNNGESVVSLLSGHLGGANRLAEKVAAITGGSAIITTASDTQAIYPLDVLAAEQNWRVLTPGRMTGMLGALVNREPVVCLTDFPLEEDSDLRRLPWQILSGRENPPQPCPNLVVITDRIVPDDIKDKYAPLILCPRSLTVGVGFNRGTSAEEIEAGCRQTLLNNGLLFEALDCVATIPEKAEEDGFQAFVSRWKLRSQVVSHDEIRRIENVPTPSVYTQELFGIAGVAEPCALVASGRKALLVPKVKYTNVTVAVARKEMTL